MPGGGYHNDLYVDITSVADRKVRALDQFVSQGYDGEYARKCVAGHNGHWGSIAGVTFAEAFVRAHAETHGHLPVAEANLTRDPVTLHRAFSHSADLWRMPRESWPTDRYRRAEAAEGATS